jgi:exonuclease VII small subunit
VSFDPGKILEDVERGSERLEKAAATYHKAVERFEVAEEEFEIAMAKARVQADVNAEKLPSQDRRQDLALIAVQRDQAGVYVEYFAAKADKEAQAVLYRALAASVNARQSLLKALQ